MFYGSISKQALKETRERGYDYAAAAIADARAAREAAHFGKAERAHHYARQAAVHSQLSQQCEPPAAHTYAMYADAVAHTAATRCSIRIAREYIRAARQRNADLIAHDR